jgi:hypothetical protein
MTGALNLTGATGDVVSQASVTASAFFGDGANLTNVTGTDATKVAKTGDTIDSGSSSSTPLTLNAATGGLTAMRMQHNGAELGRLEVQVGSMIMAGSSANTRLNYWATGTGDHNFETRGLSRMLIDDLGRVGVGVGVSDPAARLHVSSANALSTETVFLVSSGTTAGQEMLTVKGDGKIGLGTANPTSALHIKTGGIAVDGPAGNIVSAASVTASAFFGDGALMQGAISAQGGLQYSGDGTLNVGDSINDAVTVRTGAGDPFVVTTNAGTEAMRADAQSQVGIGEAAPSARLHVSSASAAVSDTVFRASGSGEFVVMGGGRVGVKTTAPGTDLDVNGFGVVRSSLTVGGTAAATGAGSTDLTVTGSTFFGTGGSYKVTNGGGGTFGIQRTGNREYSTPAASDAFITMVNWSGEVDTQRIVFSTGSASRGNGLCSISGAGALNCRGSVIGGGQPDIAEYIQAEKDVQAYEVVSISQTPGEPTAHWDESAKVRRSNSAYDPHMLGVIAGGKSGLMIGAGLNGFEDGVEGGKPLVLAGRVPLKVTTENGPIVAGDYLTSSSKPGYAMKATEPGATVGIALEAFDGSEGTEGKVLTFVSIGERNLAERVARLAAENLTIRQRLSALESIISDRTFAGR